MIIHLKTPTVMYIKNNTIRTHQPNENIYFSQEEAVKKKLVSMADTSPPFLL